MRGEGYQDFRPPVHEERYGPPGVDVCIGWHKGRSMGLGPYGSSRTHAAATTAFEVTLEGHGRSQQIGGGQEDDLMSQRPAKYRPYRPHHR